MEALRGEIAGSDPLENFAGIPADSAQAQAARLRKGFDIEFTPGIDIVVDG